jgi:hypothetical protein
MMRRVRQAAFRLVGGTCLLLLFAVPVAVFVKLSGLVGVPRAGAAGAWAPSQPPISLAGRWDVGWALNGRAPGAQQMKGLVLSDAVTVVSPPTPIPAVLTSMPTTGWTLDNGATITTDSHGALVLRPLTYGRPSGPGQGRGWRGAYQLGYAASISAAKITIQNQNGGHIFSGVLPAATSHRVGVTLTTQLTVTVDGSRVATFHTGNVRGGMGFGVWKSTATSNLPFFTKLWIRPN